MDDQRGRDDADAGDDTEGTVEQPEFGPGGYLPDRASRRARKIILRAPMGIQWVIGSLVVGVVVAMAGWLALRDSAPAAPYEQVPTAPASRVEAWVPRTTGDGAIIVRSGARSRVFAWPEATAPVHCLESGLLEADDGRAWRLTGRGVGGTPSLAEHPAVIHDGSIYADPTTTLEPLTPDPDPAETACT